MLKWLEQEWVVPTKMLRMNRLMKNSRESKCGNFGSHSEGMSTGLHKVDSFEHRLGL